MRAAAAAPSRRQRSHWQREQRQQRLLYMAVAGLVLLVVAILAGGIVYDNLIRPNDVVAQVGPDNITASELLGAMQPRARRLQPEEKRGLPDQILNQLVDEHIVQQEAARRGISVSSADVDDRARQLVAQFAQANNPAPTPEPTPAAAATPDASATPTPLPTLEPDAYSSSLKQLLDRIDLTEPEFGDALQKDVLRERVEKAVGVDQVPDTQEQVHARHILVQTEDAAKDILAQLQSGADFAQLASERSIDPGSKGKGGDLGWFPRGVMDKAFETAAFALQPGQLSDVVHGSNGYHVIQVLERDPSRPVDPTQLESLRQKAGSDWLASRRTSQDVHLQLSSSEHDWLLSRIGIRP